MKLIISILILLIPCGVHSAQPVECGTEWINIHKGNPELAGVYVKQLPDNVADQELYKGKHPVAVYYLFTNHMMHVVTYTPSGQSQDGQWWSAEDSEWLYKKVTKDFKEDVFCHFSVGNASNQSQEIGRGSSGGSR